MEWISVKEKHFVDIENFENGRYFWEQNNNCPLEPFLIGLMVDMPFKRFETHLVILTDKGLEEFTEDDTYPLDCFEITDVEYWCEITPPVEVK